MKNVLFVLPFFPYPFLSGGHQAIFNGINAVRDDANVVITFCEYPQYPILKSKAEFAKLTGNRVIVIPYVLPGPSHSEHGLLDKVRSLLGKIKKAISGAPRSSSSDYDDWMKQLLPSNEGFLKHIRSLMEQYRVDIVQCEMLEMAHIVLALPDNVKKIFVEHEIGYVRKKLRLDTKGDSSMVGHIQCEMNKMMEVALLNRFDEVITLSSIDSDKLRSAGVTTDIHTSFAIVNTPINNDTTELPISNVLSFVGPEWHPSNKSGLMWFLSECWEKLNSEHDFSLIVIGLWDEATKKSIESRYHGVSFLGYVKDLRETISNTTMIVPITVGSGIRMKILEACAIGVPVVTTSVGCEGLPLVSGEDCMIANSADDFIESILSLRDAGFRQEIITAAQNKISSQFSMASLRENRARLYK